MESIPLGFNGTIFAILQKRASYLLGPNLRLLPLHLQKQIAGGRMGLLREKTSAHVTLDGTRHFKIYNHSHLFFNGFPLKRLCSFIMYNSIFCYFKYIIAGFYFLIYEFVF